MTEGMRQDNVHCIFVLNESKWSHLELVKLERKIPVLYRSDGCLPLEVPAEINVIDT